MEEKKMNIYQKLLCITDELKSVAKNLTVGEGKHAYKAVSEVDINDAVKPLEKKYGVYSYPFSRNIIETGETETKGGARQVVLRLGTVYRFVNVDKPDEFVDITTYGDGYDTQDKAPGKAMTYADKYALMKAYKIATGENPDQEASQEFKGKSAKKNEKADDMEVANIRSQIFAQEKMSKESMERFMTLPKEQVEWVLKYYKKANVNDLTEEEVKAFFKALDEKKAKEKVKDLTDNTLPF